MKPIIMTFENYNTLMFSSLLHNYTYFLSKSYRVMTLLSSLQVYLNMLFFLDTHLLITFKNHKKRLY